MQDLEKVACSSATFPSPYRPCSQGVGSSTGSGISPEITQHFLLPPCVSQDDDWIVPISSFSHSMFPSGGGAGYFP